MKFKMTRRGFSLIELLIVVAIIAALVGVAVPFFQDNLSDAQKTKAKQDLDVVRGAINLHDAQNRPLVGSSLAPLKGRYLQEVPKDPWGSDYLLDANIGIVISFGADAQAGGQGIDQDIYFKYKPLLQIKRTQYKGSWGRALVGEEIILTMTKPFEFDNGVNTLAHTNLLRNLSTPDGNPMTFTNINTTGSVTACTWAAGAAASDFHDPINGILALRNNSNAEGDPQSITPTMAINFDHSVAYDDPLTTAWDAATYGIIETAVADGPLNKDVYGAWVMKYYTSPVPIGLYNGQDRGVKIEKF